MISKLICVAKIVAAHGIKGQVKVQVFMDEPSDITRCGDLYDERGERVFRVRLATHPLPFASRQFEQGSNMPSERPPPLKRERENIAQAFTVAIDGITDRNAAEALRGTLLYARRDALPPLKKGEHYADDFIGLQAIFEDGRAAGTVIAVHNFGAGNMLEIKLPSGKTEMLMYTKENVKEVDATAGRVTITPPENWLE